MSDFIWVEKYRPQTIDECILPENIKKTSYNDLDAHLSSNRGYLKNLHIAQLIQSADISNQDKILQPKV